MAWDQARTLLWRKLLMSRASAMGTGKKRSSWREETTRVFSTAFQKSWSLSMRSKFSNPGQALLAMDSEKFVPGAGCTNENAIALVACGTYASARSRTVTGSALKIRG